MQFLAPFEASYSVIHLRGASAIDFGQRMFSRDLRVLAEGEARMSLFLSAEGRVQSDFWLAKVADGLKLWVLAPFQKDLFDLIERYHFAEPFVTECGEVFETYWQPRADDSGEDGLAQLTNGGFEGSLCGLRVEVRDKPVQKKSGDEGAQKKWAELQRDAAMPARGKDYDASTLVFDLGFDRFCDAAKGCYIGQEVVERVRTRGGAKGRNKFWPAEKPHGAAAKIES